jgi:hypothetical protein
VPEVNLWRAEQKVKEDFSRLGEETELFALQSDRQKQPGLAAGRKTDGLEA